MNIVVEMRERIEQLGLPLNIQQQNQFSEYLAFLLEWNKKMNLTAIIKPEEIIEKHFIDSMMILNQMEVRDQVTMIDIGTGAGFPGVPIKIIREDIDVTLVDALQKRVNFLKELSIKLKVDMEIFHARAEEFILKNNVREAYDYAVSRAVAKLNVLAEYALPYVKIDGYFVSWKGPSGKEEMEEAKNAIKLLGAEYAERKDYQLATGERRSLIVMRKVKSTALEYPRKNAAMKSKPL